MLQRDLADLGFGFPSAKLVEPDKRPPKLNYAQSKTQIIFWRIPSPHGCGYKMQIRW